MSYIDITNNFHQNNSNSRAANIATAPNKQRDKQTIIKFIAQNGGKSYVKEIIRATGLLHQTASARLTELKAADVLVETGERAEKCGVVKLVNEI